MDYCKKGWQIVQLPLNYLALRLATSLSLLSLPLAVASGAAPLKTGRPNIILIVADQWRQEAFGFAGNADVKTPYLDKFAAESVRFENAVATIPVCTPTRASLLTGRYGTSTGMYMNDVPLPANIPTLPSALASVGYQTAFIGKWHLDGHGRSAFIPSERQHAFQYWKGLECTHDYNRSYYYSGSNPKQLQWPGYDADAQTADAANVIRERAESNKPFFLMLSWGPPHEPYQTAPERYRAMYAADKLHLRPNVPAEKATAARTDLAGYYAHCSAIDDCFGRLMECLRQVGADKNTIVVFTSDHGDMIGSHGSAKKQQPWEESCRVPLMVRYPAQLSGSVNASAIATEDIMPTLLGLAGIRAPRGVQGRNFVGCLSGGKDPSNGAALVMCPAPFGQWARSIGGKEYRAIRSVQYTYARDLNGPWLLFDNRTDPYQLHNLVNNPPTMQIQLSLDTELRRRLKQRGDRFEPASVLIKRNGYQVDATGTVTYEP